MSTLDSQGRCLLELLVERLKEVVPGRPETYISYKEVHVKLKLSLQGDTYGDSLKIQGLNSLANWTATENKPGITGLIIDSSTHRPGDGYFKLFGRDPESDFIWWEEQIRLSKEVDWSPYLSS